MFDEKVKELEDKIVLDDDMITKYKEDIKANKKKIAGLKKLQLEYENLTVDKPAAIQSDKEGLNALYGKSAIYADTDSIKVKP